MSYDLANEESTYKVGDKDAFHVPCVRVTSMEHFEPGQRVIFIGPSEVMSAAKNLDFDGVVDPFIKDRVYAGDPFWVLLTDGITSDVRHEFSTPFDDIDDNVESKKIALFKELEVQRAADPMCAECWTIEDGEIIRY